MENFASQIVNTGVEAMLCGLFGSLLAQAIKLMLNTIIKRKLDFRVLTTTGGMPSSHSAGVCALSTIIGIITGFTSPVFAVNVCVYVWASVSPFLALIVSGILISSNNLQL